MSAISKIDSNLNNEFKFYTSYLAFKKLKSEGVITKVEFNKITKKLIEKYHVDILPFMLNIA